MTASAPLLPAATSPTILLVDDDPVFRSLAQDTLSDSGLSVIEAIDGFEACRRCVELRPALLVVDVMMPNMDGLALCRELRARDATRHVPILMVSGLDDRAALAEAYEAGATDFITKPIEWGSFPHRVRYMLHNANILAAPNDEPEETVEPAGDEPTTPDATQARSILIVDDDPVVRALTRESLEDEGYELAEAEDGSAAYEACQRTAPEIIICDVVMPGMDGFELCRRLRQRPETASIPILMATGLDDYQSIAAAFDAGATDFIAKPLNWLILKYRVRYMLRAARAFAELVAAKERAEIADRSKSTFLANMSHELRTPLNAVIGFSELMQSAALGPISPQYAEYAKIIGDSGAHLLTIINDILDIAKAEAQGLKLGNDEAHLPEIVSFSASMVEAMAKKASIALTVEVAPALPQFRCDAKKLQQILINLLANAIKFTPAGGAVSLLVSRDPAGDLLMRIADTGVGIPQDKISVALSPFGQVDSPLAEKNDGVGLGLPLTKRLVELHDGTLRIDSEPDRGTTVTLRFPAERFVAAATTIN
jgi:two-component system cell cycle sensor histidine kinase PleC